MLKSFDPIGLSDARILILGTGPSVASLAKGEYYGFERNAFWPILSDTYGYPITTYEEKIALAHASRLALWNVLYSFEREGSLDSNYRSVTANDLVSYIEAHHQLQKVIFNGKAAARFYDRLVGYKPGMLCFITCASTSPAYTIAYAQKLDLWQAALKI